MFLGGESSEGPVVDAWNDHFRRMGLTSLKADDLVPLIAHFKVEVHDSELRLHYPRAERQDILPITQTDIGPWIAAAKRISTCSS